jgi:predicted PurR-regulated permease PerM
MADRQSESGEAWTGRIVRLALAGGVAGLILAVFNPFVSPLLWAGVLCYVLYPMYVRLLSATGGRGSLSALVMCLLLTIGVIAPLVYVSLFVAEDLTEAYRALIASLRQGNQPLLDSWRNYPLLAALAEALHNPFGLVGILAGPLVVAMGIALIESSRSVMAAGAGSQSEV